MKNDNLEKIFSDENLTPDNKFKKELYTQISNKKSRKFWKPLSMAFAVTVLALILIGFSVLRPVEKTIGKTVLLHDLYAKALADELPKIDDTTFWDIKTTTTYGASAPLCAGTDAGTLTKSTNLFYNDSVTTASLYMSDNYGGSVYQNYSEDPDIPAYDSGMFDGYESALVQQYLANSSLVDKEGNILPENATTDELDTGTYTLFAQTETPETDVKNFVEGCNNLRIKIDIDAKYGLLTGVTIYNVTDQNSLNDEQISFSITNILETGTGTFDEVQENFTKLGFDKATALKNSTNITTSVTNKEAGYEFFYNKSVLGKPTLKTVTSADGEVTAYSYTFAKLPEVNYIIYTSKNKDIVDIDRLIVSNNLEVTSDTTEDIELPIYGKVSSRTLIASNTKIKYGFRLTGSKDIPAIYVESPKNLGVYEVVDVDAGSYQQDDVMNLIWVTVFAPNTEPPTGL